MEKDLTKKEYKISWLKVLGVIAVIAIIILIIILVYPKNKNDKILSTYNQNLKLMKEVGLEYFQDLNLPENIGEAKKITLDYMLKNDLVSEILDENGKTCHKTNSYVEATKKSANEYSVKVALDCENKKDYIITTIYKDVKNDTNNEETSSKPQSNNSSGNSSSSSNNKPSGHYVNKYNITYINGCNCTNSYCGKCEAKIYHSVDFETNGGSYVEKQIVEHGALAEYKGTTKEGYKFLGWYIDSSLTKEYNFNEPVLDKLTLYAKWEKTPVKERYYTVIFDPKNGTSATVQKVKEGEKAQIIESPSKECARFKGWYLNDVKYDFNTPVYSDINLIAKYDDIVCQNYYIVNFDTNGGTKVNSQYVYEGNLVTKPNDPVRDGYEFLGWYYQNKLFDFNTKVYQNYTLIAKWEEEKTLYSTYCKQVKEILYSISYTDNKKYSYSWTIKFDKIRNTNDLKITKTGYLNDYEDYVTALKKYTSDRRISMVGENPDVNTHIPSAYAFQTYSLKSNNFNKRLSTPYYKDGYWYTDASINILTFDNATSYFEPNIKKYIYIVPFYFEVEYTNLDDCFDDLASNRYKYPYYKVIKTFYK